MAKSNNAFIKKQKEAQRRKKRLEKEERKTERKKNSKGGALQDMIVYVDENGQFSSEPPKRFPQADITNSIQQKPKTK
jgi:hypothetical protein